MKKAFAIILMAGLTLASCNLRKTSPPSAEEESQPTREIFDPLATSSDREVVPEVYPVTVAYADKKGDSLVEPRSVSYEDQDSSAGSLGPGPVYRIQIFTSRLYAEANRELALAEEIFNLPVHLDYEVPYYKLRVGDFTLKSDAEDMLPEIYAIGYRDAWVARVFRKIKEAPPYDMTDDPILPLDSTGFSPVPPDTLDTEDEGDYR